MTMSDYVTKKNLEESLDKHQAVILEAVNAGFEQARDERSKLSERLDNVEASIDRLTTTLDHFLKRLTDHEGEFTILKAEVAQMKAIIKDKLGVEVSLQGN
jgi:chromosome segregation ATPase